MRTDAEVGYENNKASSWLAIDAFHLGEFGDFYDVNLSWQYPTLDPGRSFG